MNHHRGPRMDRWTFRETMHSVTDCQYCKTLPAVIETLLILRQCLSTILQLRATSTKFQVKFFQSCNSTEKFSACILRCR